MYRRVTMPPPHDCSLIRYGSGQTTQYDLQQPSVHRGTISLRWRHLLPAVLTIRTRFLPRCIAWWFACRRNQSLVLPEAFSINLLCILNVFLGGHVYVDVPFSVSADYSLSCPHFRKSSLRIEKLGSLLLWAWNLWKCYPIVCMNT